MVLNLVYFIDERTAVRGYQCLSISSIVIMKHEVHWNLQLRSLVAADAKIHIHQHPTCLMRCRADGRVKENRFRMTPIING